MHDVARNASISLPVDVLLFDGETPWSGQAANLTMRVLCLDNGYGLDTADNTFRAAPASPDVSMVAYEAVAHNYYAVLSPGSWPRGHYRARITHTGGQEFAYDFSVGLQQDLRLGFSGAYNGTVLTLSAWVEENGVVQTDYTALNSCKILDSAGSQLADLGNLTPTNGVFKVTPTITLVQSTNYIFACTAVVAGPATVANYQFPLRVGLARP